MCFGDLQSVCLSLRLALDLLSVYLSAVFESDKNRVATILESCNQIGESAGWMGDKVEPSQRQHQQQQSSQRFEKRDPRKHLKR